MTSTAKKEVGLVVICGPTASGKTSLACALSGHFNFEIISADSRQVYREMDIGTAKPTPEELASTRHHLIDIVDPDQNYSVADYVDDARKVIEEISGRGKVPVVVGGTGLYIRALTEGLAEVPAADEKLREEFQRYEKEHGSGSLYRRLLDVDPVRAEQIHPNNLVRIIRSLEVFEQSGIPMSDYQKAHQFGARPYRVLKLYLDWPREVLYERIEQRVDIMIADGLVDEVRRLLAAGYLPALKSMQAIGYREIASYISGGTDYVETIALIKRESRRYAKRQETWFKKEKSIISVDSSREIDRIHQLIESFLLKKGRGHGQNTI